MRGAAAAAATAKHLADGLSHTFSQWVMPLAAPSPAALTSVKSYGEPTAALVNPRCGLNSRLLQLGDVEKKKHCLFVAKTERSSFELPHASVKQMRQCSNLLSGEHLDCDFSVLFGQRAAKLLACKTSLM